jgi:hypothetical protein
MHFKDLDRGELIAVAGGALLVVSLFFDWYHLGNVHATLGPCKGPDSGCTGWQGLPILRYLLLAAAVAPIILAYIIVRGHALSWPRGEMTAVISLLVLAEVLFFGPIDRPGTPRHEIHLSIGWYIALVAGLLILLGSVWRAQESSTQRKPPGVL